MKRFSIQSGFTVLLLLLGAVMNTGCAVKDKSIIDQATQTNEQLQPAIVTDPQLASYIQRVGDRIVAAGKEMDRQKIGPEAHFKKDEDNSWMFQGMKFYLVKSETINAFTTGGKYMYVYTALFDMCKTEDELAAVMSHEFAHVYCRHVQRGTQKRYEALGVAAAAGVAGAAVGGKDNALTYGGAAAAATYAGASMFLTSFTSADENQADKFGFQIYSRAGWDPGHFGDFFERLIKEKGIDPNAGGDHPPLGERVKNAERRQSELPGKASAWRKPNTADNSEFASLTSKSKQYTAQAPKDKSSQTAQTLLAAFPSCVTVDDTPKQVRARQEIQQTLDETNQKQQQGQSTDKR